MGGGLDGAGVVIGEAPAFLFRQSCPPAVQC